VNRQLHALGRFTPGVKATCTHWVGSWLGPIASLDAMESKVTEEM